MTFDNRQAGLRVLVMLATLSLALGGCGGNGGDPASLPPPSEEQPVIYSTSLIEVRVDRSADQLDMSPDGLPAEGATITVR